MTRMIMLKTGIRTNKSHLTLISENLLTTLKLIVQGRKKFIIHVICVNVYFIEFKRKVMVENVLVVDNLCVLHVLT
jgi:hypothetical protein